MGFTEAVKSAFSNYVNFSGRSARPAFWWWQLFNLCAGIATLAVDSAIFGLGEGYTPINWLYTVATILPSLAVAARRLHDIDRSGWWILLALIPLVGIIILIIWWCKPSQPGPNRFGPNPYGM
jgi:uncharacterized membrane protein YhaH (DUF805 family)